jgi:phosphoribosylformylglycinamidine synthase
MTYDELGGSEWYASQGVIGNKVPKVNAAKAKKLYAVLGKAMDKGLVASCHDCADGGLGVALAETAFSGDLGMEIDLARVPGDGLKRDDTLLFSESQSRFVVTIRPESKVAFEKIMKGNTFAEIGTICAKGIFEVKGLEGKVIIKEKIGKLKEAWQKPLRF